MIETEVTTDTLNSAVEFDCPFRMNDDGTISNVDHVYAPDVMHDPETDILIGKQWEALTGYAGRTDITAQSCIHPNISPEA